MKWGSKSSLRTLDAIHLACFVQLTQYHQITFVSSDKRLCEIVTEMGYDALTLKTPKQKLIEAAKKKVEQRQTAEH